MTGDAAYVTLTAKINSKHLGPTYTQSEIDAMFDDLDSKIDSIEDGNQEEF